MSNKQGVMKTENTPGVAAAAGGIRVGDGGAISSSSGSSGGHNEIGAGSSTGSRAATVAGPTQGTGDGATATRTSMRHKVAKHATPKKHMTSDVGGRRSGAQLFDSTVILGGGGTSDSPASTSLTDSGVSDSSESADAMRIRELEAQLHSMRVTQEMMTRQREAAEQQLLLFQQAQSLPQQHRPSAASASSLSRQQPQPAQSQAQITQPAVRVSAVQPTRLSYGSASAGSGLEDWLFSVEQLLTQMRHTEANGDDRAMIATATLYWDRPMQLWFEAEQQQQQQQRVDHGSQMDSDSAPLTTSWKEFKAALRRQFTPLADDFVARDELLSLRMRGGESMEAYMQRVVLLVTRAGQQIDGRTAATLTLRGVDELRFPFTVSAAKRKERESGTMGMSFAAMRSELTFGAHNEPKLNLHNGGNTNGSNSSGSSSHPRTARGNNSNTTTNRNKQIRIAALQQQLQELQEESEHDESSLITAPLTAGGGRTGASTGDIRCRKCGKSGHVVAECTSKTELRKCFRCNEVGHLANKCRNRGDKGKSSSAEEGVPASASMSTPKNE